MCDLNTLNSAGLYAHNHDLIYLLLSSHILLVSLLFYSILSVYTDIYVRYEHVL